MMTNRARLGADRRVDQRVDPDVDAGANAPYAAPNFAIRTNMMMVILRPSEVEPSSQSCSPGSPGLSHSGERPRRR